MKKIFVILGTCFISNNLFAYDLPEECQRFFNEADNLLERANEKKGVHPNLSNIRSQLDSSKSKISKLSRDVQIKSCDLGLAKLNYLQHQDQDNLMQ